MQHPYDPQDLNRYSYARNNPLRYTDPTGYGFWDWCKKAAKTILGIATTVISIVVPALAPAMMAVNTVISAATAISEGNIAGFVGGLVGGAVFGGIGRSLASSIAGTMTSSFANTFMGGAIIGAVEFGISGFGAGLGAGLASGQGLPGALRSAGMGAAFGAVTGAAIQGSYMAGWQNSVHGLSKGDITAAQAKNDPIVNNPVVRAGMERAWKESFSSNGKIVNEQGGWIRKNAKNALEVQRWPQGESGSISPTHKPDNAVAHFHTHPYASNEMFVHRPSDADIEVTKIFGIPGYIVDKKGIMYVDPKTGKWRDIE